MNPTITQIKHSELFSSADSFLEFIRPKDVEGDERKICRGYKLPSWHPFSIKGMGVIASSKGLEDGQIELILAFPVSKDPPLAVSVANNWMIHEKFVSSFDGLAAYFVNGTEFGIEGGTAVITEGPKEFTWTFKPKENP